MSELTELKRLLLGEEAGVLEALKTPAGRAGVVGDALPAALHRAGRDAESLNGALQGPVAACIRRSVQQDSRLFADALYPAMGPAIRKSIAEALKGLVQSLNQALEYSLSARGLRWRWEAWRSGLSFAEVVVRNTLIYRVEETYLIHRESGLLIGRVGLERGDEAKDEEAVSAMLTAIGDFVHDSFSAGDLETVDMGDLTLWALRGPHATMACLIRGIPPRGLRDRLTVLLEQVHAVYGPQLERFDGERSGLSGLQQMLAPSLEAERHAGSAGPGRRLRPLVLLLLLAAAGTGAWLWHAERLAQQVQAQRQALLQALEREPGIAPVHWQRQGGRLLVTALRDPLARAPATVAAESGFPPGGVAFRLIAFQSLEPALVLARARRLLAPPAGVTLALEDGVLRIAGRAAPAWYDRVRRRLVLPAGVERIDLDALVEDRAAMEAQLRSALAPPEGVSLTLDGRTLRLAGSAPWDWIDSLAGRLAAIDWLAGCSGDGLEIAEWREVQALRLRIEAAQLHFSEDMALGPGGQAALAEVSGLLRRVFELDRLLHLDARVTLVGHSDGIGTEQWNMWLRGRRAETVRAALAERGLDAGRMQVRVAPGFTPAVQPDPAQRRVGLKLALTPPEPSRLNCR